MDKYRKKEKNRLEREIIILKQQNDELDNKIFRLKNECRFNDMQLRALRKRFKVYGD